ncbi:MAG: hypothetical protein U0414_21125 [Polyangiaceae bacterium]
MRRWLVPASLLILVAPATSALADGDCPPGSWFCEETTVTPPPDNGGADQGDAADTDDTPDQAQPTEDAPAPKKRKKKHKGGTQIQTNGPVQVQANGPIIIYTNGGPVQGRPAPPPQRPPPPTNGPGLKPMPTAPWRERFGLNLHLEGLGFEDVNGETTGMGGLGVGFRWRPAPAFAFDVGIDLVGGSDYYGKDRIESGLSLTGMLYFNPKSVFQVYALGGVHLAHAEITDQNFTYDQFGYDFYAPSVSRDYLGLHAGLGVEWRVGKHLGLDVDGVGLIRTGINNDGDEFRNPNTGETTDTSGAGMLRAGVTFWW